MERGGEGSAFEAMNESGTAATEIARRKGVDASVLYRWRRQFAAERPVRFRPINHFYTFRFHAYQLTKRRPQEPPVLRVRLEQHHVFLASKMSEWKRIRRHTLRNFVREIGVSSCLFVESSRLALLNARFLTEETLALGYRVKLVCIQSVN